MEKKELKKFKKKKLTLGMVTVCCAKQSVVVYSAYGLWQIPNRSGHRGLWPYSPEARKLNVFGGGGLRIRVLYHRNQVGHIYTRDPSTSVEYLNFLFESRVRSPHRQPPNGVTFGFKLVVNRKFWRKSSVSLKK